MNLVRATLASDNTVYAQLILDVGPKAVRETAKLMGITTKLDAYPAEGLGGLRLGVSPLEMANAYATLASGGMRNKPKAHHARWSSPTASPTTSASPSASACSPTAWPTRSRRSSSRTCTGGTGTRAQIGCPAAGKTGTTDDFNDAWFVGYTPKLASSVWVGYPNALVEMRSVHGISVAGGTFPAEIWHDYMTSRTATTARPSSCPTEPAKFSPFFGKYASTGRSGSTYDGYDEQQTPTTGGTGDNSAGGENYRGGYDPRLYESPPQGRRTARPTPATAAPAPDAARAGLAPTHGPRR